jgi:dTDP-L-rhamnose 4-epimerase
MKNILVTGGAGFIGSKISLKLIKQGYNVTILDNLSEQIHGKDAKLADELKNKVNFIKGDVRNKQDWRLALKDQDAVIHLAAETGTGQSMYEISKYVETNIGGTANLLDILTNEHHTIKKVVVASSRAIYGEGRYKCREHGFVYPIARKDEDMLSGDFECKCPICGGKVELISTDENSKIHPTSIYGITKYNQEEMVLVVCKSINIPAVAFRYQNVYGPGQSLSNPYTGILSIFSTRIKNGNSINIFEDGKETRDFVYIDDVADATILGLEKDQANYEIFNVGSGVATDVVTVTNTLRDAYNSNTEIKVSGNYRLGDIRHNYADISKIKDKLGFEPKYNFEQGIRQFVNWVKIQKVYEDKYEKSIEEMKAKGLYK